MPPVPDFVPAALAHSQRFRMQRQRHAQALRAQELLPRGAGITAQDLGSHENTRPAVAARWAWLWSFPVLYSLPFLVETAYF
jgi:hypothetical protein